MGCRWEFTNFGSHFQLFSTEPVNMHTGAVFVLKYRYIRPFLLDSLLELL